MDAARSRARRTPASTLEHVTPGRDDDALSWSGDDDPTLDVGMPAQRPPEAPSDAEPPRAAETETDGVAPDTTDAAPAALPDGYTAVGRGSADVGRIDGDGTVHLPGDRPAVGSGTLIALGVFGGVYLLYAIGWVIGGLRLQGRAAYLVADVMFQGSLWLAVLAPLLWFATVLLLTRAARAWVRLVWLAAGVLLLLPWPFVMIGAVGQ